MDQFIITLISTLGVATVILGFLGYHIVRNPEKIEKWAAILAKIMSGLGGLFKWAHRTSVKLDLQGRVNSFTKKIASSTPFLEDTRIVVEWVDTTVDQKAFLRNGKAVLRLRREDPDELNFVHGAYLAVATRLVPKVKRYISKSQSMSIDLFVTSKLMEAEKTSVIEYFLEHYLHRHVGEDGKIAELFAQYAEIDAYGAFYPIFLQELYFLSMKVYGGLKDDRIIVDVTNLVNFLERVAARPEGEQIELNFTGEFCRFGIVIVGTGAKMSLEGINPYRNYIRNIAKTKRVETVYVLGKHEYKDFIEEVCSEVTDSFETYTFTSYDAQIWDRRGRRVRKKQSLMVLRARNVALFQPGKK